MAGCAHCARLGEEYTYGLGVALRGFWFEQSPDIGGFSSIEPYHPEQPIALAVVVTYRVRELR